MLFRSAEAVRVQQQLGADEGREPVEEILEPTVLEPEASLPALVIVDDDSCMAEALADELQRWFKVSAFTKSEEALVKVDALFRSGSCPVVLVDLIMPKMDGTGVLGGLELIRLLQRNFAGIRLAAVSDFHHAEAVSELSGLGCPFLIKPRRGDTQGEQFASFLSNVKDILQLQG